MAFNKQLFFLLLLFFIVNFYWTSGTSGLWCVDLVYACVMCLSLWMFWVSGVVHWCNNNIP